MKTHLYLTLLATALFTPFIAPIVVGSSPLQASELSQNQTVKVSSAQASESEFLTVASLFKQMDSDKNGRIDPNEVNKQSVLSSQFSNVDQNRNGSLDAREFEVFIAKVDI